MGASRTAVAGSRVAALGHYQPPNVLTNDRLAELVDTSDEWIRRRVGIVTRHMAGDESVEEMAALAAGKALATSGLSASDIDLVIVATSTAGHAMPNIASRVSAALGITAPAAYDLNTACSGFSYALATADHAIKAGAARHALVVAAEKPSDVTDWSDRSTCILLGDGAGAAVVSQAENAEIGPVAWGSCPEQGNTVRIDDGHFRQEGQSVFRWVLSSMAEVARRACRLADVLPEDLGAFVPHQANLRIIEPLARQIGLAKAVLARDVIHSGNTFAASVPLALAKLVERREIPSGAPVLLLGFGGGLSYAGQVIHCP